MNRFEERNGWYIIRSHFITDVLSPDSAVHLNRTFEQSESVVDLVAGTQATREIIWVPGVDLSGSKAVVYLDGRGLSERAYAERSAEFACLKPYFPNHIYRARPPLITLPYIQYADTMNSVDVVYLSGFGMLATWQCPASYYIIGYIGEEAKDALLR